MAVCLVLVSAVLFHYVPAEGVKKTATYIFRDLTESNDGIVLVYPSISNKEMPERFNVSKTSETYDITYTWFYDEQAYSHRAEIPQELVGYYKNRSHVRQDYAQYAVSEYDREVIRKLADSFGAHGRQNKYSDTEIALNVISFVHTIPYTYDSETTGFAEYPRYPVETLVEGGDCEDRAVLAAAVFYELDIDCVLILMKDHMALGLKDDGNLSGQSYSHNGTVYYYAGVTDGETVVGIISEKIDPTLLEIFPIIQKPVLSAKTSQFMNGSMDGSYKYTLQAVIENTGAGHGKNISLRAVTELKDASGTYVPDQLIPLGMIQEDSSIDIEADIKAPKENGVITYYIEGENMDPIKAGGFYFNFKDR